MRYRPDQQHNMRSRMESYTPAEHDAAWGDDERDERDPEDEPEDEAR